MRVTRRAKPVEPAPAPEPEVIIVQQEEVPAANAEPTGTDYQAIVQKYREKVRSPKTAIRAKCVECMGGYVSEIVNCTSTGCPLYQFRMGKNPFNKRTGVSRAFPTAKKEEANEPRPVRKRK